MAKIIVSENQNEKNNLFYIQSCLSELFIRTGCSVLEKDGERCDFIIECKDCYEEILLAEIFDKIAEVIVVKYKYDFFKKNIKIAGLNVNEYEILMASLIAADLEDDKKYCIKKLPKTNKINIDGFYNFRLNALKKKWLEVASYMPPSFINSQLKDFVTFLLENKKKRSYIDSGRVYDQHFRRLLRCSLIEYEKAKIIREVLISNCGEVEINGTLEPDDEFYLKEFYKDKIYFSH